MVIRPKLLLTLTALGIVLLVALSVINYLYGARSLESQLRADLQREARGVATEVERRLREREESMAALASSPSLREYVKGGPSQPPARVPEDLQAELRAFLQGGQKSYVAVACLSAARQPLFRAELNRGGGGAALRVQTQDFLPGGVQPDERVWASADATPLKSGPTRESYGSALRYTLPVFIEEENQSAPRGALIVELSLDALLNDAARDSDYHQPPPARASKPLTRVVVVLNRAGGVLYHTNDALKYQPVATAMPPSFAPVTDAMKRGESGWQFYDATGGESWLAAYEQVAPLNLAVAVAADYTEAARGLRWVGRLSVGLTALLGLLTLALLFFALRRTAGSIERVTEAAAAIAGGRLDERIEVRSSDDVRLLAESFNAMTSRLREQLAREAETRQFESFMRLSAMLTHDLKNSILALSLLVSNMEEQFHREEFRADAMRSLTEATDNLRQLVARLSEPVRSLSGEFKRPRPVDLVPIIKRVVARLSEPATTRHEVEIKLPQSLVAVADDERIEKVVENLVLNAIEAMGAEKGELRVEAGPAEEGFVFFSVSDTGPGMSEEFQRTKLFRAFATTKKKGVGLGLYTCRELVHALGGRIEVQSARGSGTTFRVVLPSGQIKGSAESLSSRDG